MDMPKCEAHSMIERELSRVKDNESELYSLDRERQQQIAEMTADVREIKNEQQTMKKDITELKETVTEVNNHVNKVDNKIDKLTTDFENVKNVTNRMIETLTEYTQKSKWQPKDYCVVIVAALSMIGVIVSAILTYLK